MFIRQDRGINFWYLVYGVLVLVALGTVAGCDTDNVSNNTTIELERTRLPLPQPTLVVRFTQTDEIFDLTPTPLLLPTPTIEVIDFSDWFPSVPPGLGEVANHLIFYSDRSGVYQLYEVTLDGSELIQLTHNPNIDVYDTEPAWSSDGKIAFTSTHANGFWEVFVIMPGRLPMQISNLGADSWSLAWSPNGESLVFVSNVTGDDEIYLVTPDGSEPVNITQHPDANDFSPSWSPTGERIAFVSDRVGSESVFQESDQDIFVMASDGSAVTRLTEVEGRDTSPNWSPDGDKIAFVSEREGNFEVYVMAFDGTDPVRLTQTSGYEWSPTWSPDGKLIAFTSLRDHPENYEVYIMEPDGSNQTRLTFDPADDIIPRWWP